MATFNTKKNQAICVLPWVHEFRTVDGNVGPCCQGDTLIGNETLESIRQQMLKGEKPRACMKCYKKEKESDFSPRINETIDWLKKFGEPDVHQPSIQFVDVRYDPTCNLKCKTCGPGSSTLWQKEKNFFRPINASNKEYLSSIDKKILKKIYLAGGEPTYIKGYQDFLEELFVVNPSCEVIINTNLKKLPEAWKNIIKRFKNLTIICSCDATETLGTYVRYPLGWSEFENNVDWVSKHANFLQFNLVASNLTTHRLFETCLWMKKYSKNINLSILTDPACFSECAVPPHNRNEYIDNVTKLLRFPVSVHYALNFRSKIQYLIKKYLESTYKQSLHEKLLNEVTEQDSHRTLKLRDVDSFLHGWIYG
jgi:organic radical activating enzyme